MYTVSPNEQQNEQTFTAEYLHINTMDAVEIHQEQCHRTFFAYFTKKNQKEM